MTKAYSGKFLLSAFTDSSFGIISFVVDMGFIIISGFYIIGMKVCDYVLKKEL
jgi:hypothetical protein